MTTIAPVPRVPLRRPAPVIPLPGCPANTGTVPRPPRALSTTEMAEVRHVCREHDAERERLSHFAEMRGAWNDDTDPLPSRRGLILTYVAAFFVGAGVWLTIISAVWSALTGDLSLMEF